MLEGEQVMNNPDAMNQIWSYQDQLDQISRAYRFHMSKYDESEDGSEDKRAALLSMGQLDGRREAIQQSINTLMGEVEES